MMLSGMNLCAVGCKKEENGEIFRFLIATNYANAKIIFLYLVDPTKIFKQLSHPGLTMFEEHPTCVFCHEKCETKWGNNTQPVAVGKCCDACHSNVVMGARAVHIQQEIKDIKQKYECEVADTNMKQLLKCEEAEERERSSSDSDSSTKSSYEIPEDVRRILPLIPPKPKAYTDKAGIMHKPSQAEISAYNEKWGPYLKYMRMYKKEKKGK